jgi:hypothetical protein
MSFNYAQVSNPVVDPFEFPSFQAPSQSSTSPAHVNVIGISNMSNGMGQSDHCAPVNPNSPTGHIYSSSIDSSNTTSTNSSTASESLISNFQAPSLPSVSFVLDSQRVGSFSSDFKQRIRCHTERPLPDGAHAQPIAWNSALPPNLNSQRTEKPTREENQSRATVDKTTRSLKKDYLGQPQPEQGYCALNNKVG